MNAQKAPLYVKSVDLTVWTLTQVAIGMDSHGSPIFKRLVDHLLFLVEEVSVAVEFGENRYERLRRIDMMLRRIKTLFVVLERSGAISAKQNLYAWQRLLEIGRMVGGFMKRQNPSQKSLSKL